MWSDWANLRHFGNILKTFGPFWRVRLVFGKIFHQLWQIFNAIGHIWILENSQISNKLSSHLVTLAATNHFLMTYCANLMMIMRRMMLIFQTQDLNLILKLHPLGIIISSWATDRQTMDWPPGDCIESIENLWLENTHSLRKWNNPTYHCTYIWPYVSLVWSRPKSTWVCCWFTITKQLNPNK